MSSFRLAHISDLHFSHITFRFRHLLSKQWVGNANLWLRRKREFDHSLLEELPSLFRSKGVEKVLISGDLSCSSSEEEFLKAVAFVQKLQAEGLQPILLPGNHDHYTKEAYRKKIFYRFFPSPAKEDRLHAEALSPSWWIVTLDTSIATPLFCCHGLFSEKLEHRLEATLFDLPVDAKVMLANHFPLPSCDKKALQRGEQLQDLLKRHPKVKLYLHGHTHKNRIFDLRSSHLPITVDAGSAAHQFAGGWNLIESSDSETSVHPFLWQRQQWISQQPHHFTW